ncbi:MAG: polyprenyl synthetase family protein [Paracoccaceae bacterium]|nr:polyprenyl synthetase family protein [Paracoccaceae bacterium]
MQSVDELINNRMFSEHAPLIQNLTNHLINAGGKRLRPLLTLAAANICNYRAKYHIHLAAIVEFIHTATLLHDDVIDESLKRRGRPTANRLWDNKSSVLVGDFLFARAFQLMVETESLKVLDSLSNASAEISESEVLQMSLSQNLSTSKDQYMQVIRGKTAILFASACEVGGLIAEAKNEHVEALRLYGEALGISFQIVDDFLDYTGNKSNLGKNIGDDFREKKITLPIIYSLQKKNNTNYLFWKRTLEKGHQKIEDFEIAQKVLIDDGSLDKTRLDAIYWSNIAKSQLKFLPESQFNKLLVKLTDYVVARVS